MKAEIIILCVTGLGWLIGQWWLKNKELSYKHFDQKVAAYQKYLTSFVEMSINIRKHKPINMEEGYRALLNFKEAILVWGKPRMIKDFVKYQKLLNHIEDDIYNPILTMDFLEKMIRRDLGHNDFFLRKGQLAQIFLEEDVKSILKQRKHKTKQ